LKDLIGTLDRPRYKGKPFPWAVLYSDGHQRRDGRLQTPSDAAVVTVDFRYLAHSEERNSATWVQASDTPQLRDRLIWVVGQPGTLPGWLRDLARSRHMVQRYGARLQSLPRDKQRLYFEEQSRSEDLDQRGVIALFPRLVPSGRRHQHRKESLTSSWHEWGWQEGAPLVK
jgi:hypothetical protein